MSLVDGRSEPLSRKLLARPGALERIRRLIGEPEVAMIIPFCMTSDEVGLRLGVWGTAIYGSDLAPNWLGSQSGSLEALLADGSREKDPRGLDFRSSDDRAAAPSEDQRRSPSTPWPAPKRLAVSGLGNVLLDLDAAKRDLGAAIELEDEEIESISPSRSSTSRADVEERIQGEAFRSPSVQRRVSPAGQVDIMSTTIRFLAGRTARRLRLRLPSRSWICGADRGRGAQGRSPARAGGRHRSRSGRLRCRAARWSVAAVCARDQLRCGGTTHPLSC